MRAAALALVVACGGAKPVAPVGNVAGAPRLVVAQSEDIIEEESHSRLEIDELSAAGLRRIARLDRMVQAFGFRDPQTLVVLLAGSGDDRTVEIYKDGKVTDTIAIKAAELAADPFGGIAFTKTNEVWLTADCDDASDACKRLLRVLPAPRMLAAKPPPGIEPERSAGRWTGRLPRQVLAPVGIEVGFTRGMNGEGTVTCSSPSGKTANDKLKPSDVRWVRAQPPIYEVTYDDEPTPGRGYFRACEDTQYAAYRELPDGMWVLSGPMMDVGLMLTFFQGDKQIGQIERGGDFITNR